MRRSFEECKEPVLNLLKKSPFVDVIGFEMVSLEEGKAIGRAPLKKENLNPYGSMHGGCLYSLADTTTGTLANSCGEIVVTLNGNLNFLEMAGNSEYIYCEATLIRCGRTTVLVRAELKNDEGKLLDEGTFTFFRTGMDVVTGEKLR